VYARVCLCALASFYPKASVMMCVCSCVNVCVCVSSCSLLPKGICDDMCVCVCVLCVSGGGGAGASELLCHRASAAPRVFFCVCVCVCVCAAVFLKSIYHIDRYENMDFRLLKSI
jgi:hypothetical protein